MRVKRNSSPASPGSPSGSYEEGALRRLFCFGPKRAIISTCFGFEIPCLSLDRGGFGLYKVIMFCPVSLAEFDGFAGGWGGLMILKMNRV